MDKEYLLNKLRSQVKTQYDMPDMHIEGIKYDDTLKQFIEMTENVGGKVARVKKTDDLNALMKNLYPDAKVFASNLPYIKIAQMNPDTVAEAADLDGTDVGIVKGEIGVAENGCIWIPQTMKERAVCFISEYLVILLDEQDVVDNMHEAYERITMTDYGYGTFISGPSKTADIEQALVMGAQAARGVTVVLLS
jgi:L-lactate dehydrogenase complex protein LldG